MPNDKAYWSQVNRARRNVRCHSKWPKEIPKGVAKIPNLIPSADHTEKEPELQYCPEPVKASQHAPDRSKRQLRVGTRGFVCDAEWRFRHWCDRVLDEQDACEYCGSKENLTVVPNPGTKLEDATMERLCSMCPECIQDQQEFLSI